MTIRTFSDFTSVLCLVVFAHGCSTSQRPDIEIVSANDVASLERGERKYEVSVSTGSTTISDFEAPLVHRIQLSKTEFQEITSAGPGKLNISFGGISEFDNHGGVMGVRLVKKPGAYSVNTLGMREDDLVTAVERVHVESLNDLWLMFDALEKNGQASLTLQRQGRPHKFYYSILSTNSNL